MPRGLILQQVAHIITTVVHKEEDIFVLRLDWICGPAFSTGMYNSRQAGCPDEYILYCGAEYVWVLSMEHASCQNFGA